MTLAAGDRLGPYEITAKLGEGGMGLVYRARDFQLGRDVALKVLPDPFTDDAERMARFEREAKLLAQLNHPNIAQIYGFEASGATKALAMELVEGPTLAERLEGRSFSVEESLSIAIQIAHALEEAHEKGIIHRDLKPQNVKASLEGKVKVLDFGLAKAMDPTGGTPASASQLAHSPTLTLGGTAMGTILGTAAYMAPEQARGGTVDRRADIWAFGVVLYEMLAGGRLFDGESAMDTLSAVMRQEIDFERLPDGTPRRVKELLRRCLERNPRNRLHHIADARIELEEALARPERASAAPVARRGVSPWLIASMALLAALIGLLALRPPFGGAEPAAVRPHRLSWGLPAGLTPAPVEEESPLVAISPDGSTLAAALADADGRIDLYVRALDSLDTRLLAGTDDASEPFFSPDGTAVAFFAEGQLKKVAVAGGAATKVADALDSRGGAWLPDGRIVFAKSVDQGLFLVGSAGGEVRALTTVDAAAGERSHRWPQVLPGGRFALFTVGTLASPDFYDDARIDAVEIATGKRSHVLDGASFARYVPSAGALFFGRGGALHAIRFDPETLASSGEPVLVLDGVGSDVTTGAVHAMFAADGTLVYLSADPLAAESRLGWIGTDGRVEPLGAPARNYWSWSLSPDGTKLATLITSKVSGELWMYDLSRDVLSRLSSGETCNDPLWSPDGQFILYSRAAGAGAEIVRRPVHGGEPEVLLSRRDRGGYLYVRSITADGSRLYFEAQSPGTASDLFELRLDPPGEPRTVLATPFDEYFPAVSPDGRWLVYVSQESGRGEVYLRSSGAGDERWQLSNGGAAQPMWSPDGSAVYFRTATGLARVDLSFSPQVVASAARTVLATTLGIRRSLFSYTLGRDGRFLTSLSSLQGSRPQVVVVLGFGPEVRSRLERAARSKS